MKTNEPEIRILIEQCLKNNAAAQSAIYERYSRAMYSSAVRILGKNEDAEDALQEAFFKAFTNLKNYNGSASFGAWLKRITINECLNKLRRRELKWLELDFDLPTADEQEEIPHIEPEVLNDLIEKLPSGCKTVFSLKAIEGYSHEEIARDLNISLSTSKSQFVRAKKLLSLSLKKLIQL